MIIWNNQLEMRKVVISSLITCIYLPSIITVISYMGLLYTIGKGSSAYILFLIFIAELLKSFYLSSEVDTQAKRMAKASKSRVGDLLVTTGTLLAVTMTFFIGTILFGAPVFDMHEETLMLSGLLTLLTVFPLIAHSGVELTFQLLFGVKNYSKDSIVGMLVSNVLLTICGAWLGAAVIPLDWNTPWQVWPIPCYLGAVGGYLLASVLNVIKVTLMTTAQKYPALKFFITIIDKVHVCK